MTGMSDAAWQKVKDVGAQVSLAVPIEMNMRHGMPPILKMQQLGMEPSLSVDVECTLTADFFTQMRSAMNMQRMLVNQMILEQGDFVIRPTTWPTPAAGTAAAATTRDVLRFATMNGAKAPAARPQDRLAHARARRPTSSSSTPRRSTSRRSTSVPGAVVSLMDRTNVETVIVAGKVRKWKGKLLDVDLRRLRRQLEDSRDFIFDAAKIPANLRGPFGQN